jgi:hypothetical protein
MFEMKAVSAWLAENRDRDTTPEAEGWCLDHGALKRPDIFGGATGFDLTSDSVAFMSAKLRHVRGKRISFPVPKDLVNFLQRQERPHENASLNGIFCGLLKIGPNPMNPFFNGWAINGEKMMDWLVVVRDVLLVTENEESMLFPSSNRKRNKRRPLEFTLSSLLQAARDSVKPM